jgi:uncharacterized protein with von Willebrand factor type A (vWA) domain
MIEFPALELPDAPKLVHNITHFARALRKAGLPMGPQRSMDAIRAVQAAGFTSKTDFYWVLHACFVSRPEHRAVFAQVFRLYWRDPRYLEHMMSLMLPAMRGVAEDRQLQAAEKRAAEALLDGATQEPPLQAEEGETEIAVDATLTMSTEERLRTLDFEQMSAAEIAAAKQILAGFSLPVPRLPSRRMQRVSNGRLPDWRRTMQHSLRKGGEMTQVLRRAPGTRWPNLVTLCDISGSMANYSRIVLHFLHAVANRKGAGWAQVHAFTFGTRLTNITRHFATRDVDAALAAAGAEAQDWQGGTRIGDCLTEFNRTWSRRVMGQGAVVLLITDGLDRGEPEGVSKAMERLHLTAKHIIWLNPLLRFEGFAPKAAGIAAMLPHVDSFRAGHSIASLEDLAHALARPDDAGIRPEMMRRLT